MMQEKKIFRPLKSSDVCEIYNLLYTEGFIAFPLTHDAVKSVEASIASITSTYFGVEIYRTPQEKAVAYLYFLIKNHPFTDGNKRTASLAFEVVCALNDMTPCYDTFTLDMVAVYLEESRSVDDYQKLIRSVTSLLFPQ